MLQNNTILIICAKQNLVNNNNKYFIKLQYSTKVKVRIKREKYIMKILYY